MEKILDFNYKTIGVLAIGVGIGYYIGTRKQEKKLNNPKNTFYLYDTHQSTWDSLFSPSINHLENLYNSLTTVPDDEPINIVVKTHGGSLLWSNKICLLFKKRSGKVRVFVKDYAHSAGTLLALAADEIYMNHYSTMSAIDPQVDTLGFISYLPLKNLSSILKDRDGLRSYITDNSDYHRIDTMRMINENHDINKIMEVMYDNVKDHATLFQKEDVENLGISILDWNGIDIPNSISNGILNDE